MAEPSARVQQEPYADGSQERYQYERLNSLTNKVETAGVSTGYGYDPNGNLISIKYGSLSPVTFGYDALNRRKNMAQAVNTTVWTCDSLGRLSTERSPFSRNDVRVGYDEQGRMTSVVYGATRAVRESKARERRAGGSTNRGGLAAAVLAVVRAARQRRDGGRPTGQGRG